jgi:hypothetical protein
VKVLFVARHFGCLRNYERPILALAARGHRLRLVALTGDIHAGQAMVERWAADNPRITFERLPEPPPGDTRADLSERLHLMVDYLRYLEPAYAAAPGLVERARRRTPRGLLAALDLPGGRTRPGRRLVGSMARGIEGVVPRRPEIDAFMRAEAPDVALFTPLIGLGSEEQDYLAAASRLGLRTVFCVWSWDNLSSKSIIRTLPDALIVWNDSQKDEAVALHGMPAERVIVTGAQSFDQWFDRRPTRTREEFCARVGLPADRPFLLWVCSALLKGSPVEARFVRRWLEAIRASAHPELRSVPVLVRPHPSRLKEWQDVALEGLGPVSRWGANPIDPEAKADYFESLHYSAAVAGINTSAFLEAAIVGRPVYSVLLPEYYENQEGTLHFPYLLHVAGGLLHTERSLDAHLDDLAGALARPVEAARRSTDFVRAFVRPHGLEVAATDRFVEAIEGVAGRPAAGAVRPSTGAWLFRPALGWLERHANDAAVRNLLLSPTEYREEVARASRVQADREAQEQRVAERRRERDARLREKEQAREAWRQEKRDRKLMQQSRVAEKERQRELRLRAKRLQRVREYAGRVKGRLTRLVGLAKT